MCSVGRLQPGEKGLADLLAPAPHGLLVGLAVIEVISRHGLLYPNGRPSQVWGRRDDSVGGYCGFRPAAFTKSAFLTISLCTWAAKSAGDISIGSTPSAASFSATF